MNKEIRQLIIKFFKEYTEQEKLQDLKNYGYGRSNYTKKEITQTIMQMREEKELYTVRGLYGYVGIHWDTVDKNNH